MDYTIILALMGGLGLFLYGMKLMSDGLDLSVVGVGYLKGAVPSTRGPGWTHLWCTCCHASGTAGQLCAERINAESI